MSENIGKICPLTQKPCTIDCAWMRLVKPDTRKRLIYLIAKGEKPL